MISKSKKNILKYLCLSIFILLLSCKQEKKSAFPPLRTVTKDIENAFVRKDLEAKYPREQLAALQVLGVPTEIRFGIWNYKVGEEWLQIQFCADGMHLITIKKLTVSENYGSSEALGSHRCYYCINGKDDRPIEELSEVEKAQRKLYLEGFEKGLAKLTFIENVEQARKVLVLLHKK